MDLGEAVIVAGLGCRKGVSADEVEAAIEAALSSHRLAAHQLQAIAVPATRAAEAGIAAVAAMRGIELVPVGQNALEDADARTLTRSGRSKAALNVGSASEAAALATAGKRARLLSPRIAVGPVTCALAAMEELP